MSIEAIQAGEALNVQRTRELLGNVVQADIHSQHFAPAQSFQQLLEQGVTQVSSRMGHADALVKAFAVDDSVPLHQVTFALEQARLSFELMLQVRDRLLESYQQLMNTQL